VYWALFDAGPGAPVRRTADALGSPRMALAAAAYAHRVIVIGSGAELVAEASRARSGGGGPECDVFPHDVPSAAWVGRLGARALSRGDVPDLDALEPAYLRPTDAERLRRPPGGG